MLELKAGADLTLDGLAKLADQALDQIDEKNCVTSLRQLGAEQIFTCGIAFQKKQVQIKHAEEDLSIL